MSEFRELLLQTVQKSFGEDTVEAQILVRRYGLNGTGWHTLAEIGHDLGYPREGVRKLERRSLMQLNRHVGARPNSNPTTSGLSVRTYLDRKLNGTDDSLIDFAISEFGTTIPLPYALFLVNNLVFRSSGRVKRLLTRYGERGLDVKPTTILPRLNHYLNILFEDINWPKESKSWTPDQFVEKTPTRRSNPPVVNFSTKLNRHVICKSNFDLEFSILLELHDEVAYYLEYPFMAEVREDDRVRNVWPNFFVLLRSGHGVAVVLRNQFDFITYSDKGLWPLFRDYAHERGMGTLYTNGVVTLDYFLRQPIPLDFDITLYDRLQRNGLMFWKEYSELCEHYRCDPMLVIPIVHKANLIFQKREFLLAPPEE